MKTRKDISTLPRTSKSEERMIYPRPLLLLDEGEIICVAWNVTMSDGSAGNKWFRAQVFIKNESNVALLYEDGDLMWHPSHTEMVFETETEHDESLKRAQQQSSSNAVIASQLFRGKSLQWQLLNTLPPRKEPPASACAGDPINDLFLPSSNSVKKDSAARVDTRPAPSPSSASRLTN